MRNNLVVLILVCVGVFILARPVAPLPRPVPGADKKFDASLYVMGVFNVADLYTSLRAFDNGYRELTPILAPFHKNDALFCAVKLSFAAINHIGLKWMYKKNKTVAWCLSIAANIALGYVIYENGRLR